jgi:hypothetical protein
MGPARRVSIQALIPGLDVGSANPHNHEMWISLCPSKSLLFRIKKAIDYDRVAFRWVSLASSVRCACVSSNLEKKVLRQSLVCATTAESKLILKRKGIRLASFVEINKKAPHHLSDIEVESISA